ncbi:MAG TPA: hypothetical protein VFG00_05140 [Acidothermaceae bacterium]|nr:hypothetical protein [Acidothermaceae bacterium]
MFDEAEVHEQFTEAPALEFCALCLERLGQVLWDEGVARDQSSTELRTLARYRNRVNQPSLEVDKSLAADVVNDMETASGLLVCEATERNFDGGGREVAFEHGRPPTLERLLR